MQIISSEKLIILHELAKQALKVMTFNSQRGCFEMTRPLDLVLELSHYRDLEATEKTLSHVLENLQGMALKDSTAANLSIEPRNDATPQADSHRAKAAD